MTQSLGTHVWHIYHAEIRAHAHAILLPAFASNHLSGQVERFLTSGGCAILLGETRDEYVAREMSAERRRLETPEVIRSVVEEARKQSANLLVVVDQEIAGICRLHELVPSFPERTQIEHVPETEFEDMAFEVGRAAKALGINCFLAPILDVPIGENPWLAGRTWTQDVELLGRLSGAFVRGVQRAGVAATAKHFPGFHRIAEDPAIHADARVTDSAESFEPGFGPFRDVVDSGVELIMTGPAIVEAFDPEQPASTSEAIIGKLKNEFGFRGVIMTDDLDAKATLRGRTIERTAIDAVNAGANLLLLADSGNQIEHVALAIAAATQNGEIPYERLAEAAGKIRTLSAKYSAR